MFFFHFTSFPPFSHILGNVTMFCFLIYIFDMVDHVPVCLFKLLLSILLLLLCHHYVLLDLSMFIFSYLVIFLLYTELFWFYSVILCHYIHIFLIFFIFFSSFLLLLQLIPLFLLSFAINI